MDSRIGLAIQFAGIFLITVLSLFMRRSLKSKASAYWLIAWSSLSIALFCLSMGFTFEKFAQPLFGLYFLGEYVFGLMLINGCRSLIDEKPLNNLLIVPAIPAATVLAALAFDFNEVFNIHGFILATLFLISFLSVKTKDKTRKTFGWRVIRVALCLLSIDFYHYVVLFTLKENRINFFLPNDYLTFSPAVDLVLEVMLGFGMVIVSLEGVLREIQKKNELLTEAHTKLEQLVQTDPLTTAFNRHAFYGFMKKHGGDGETVSGCVGFFDIDNLKPLNDRFGHDVGDAAIRAAVRAIRSLMRAEDLIYRWGGDEFFVVMVSMNEAAARSRMDDLESILTEIHIEGADIPLTLGVSYGFKNFNDVAELEKAVKAADEAMYRHKEARKQARLSKTNFIPAAPDIRQNLNI